MKHNLLLLATALATPFVAGAKAKTPKKVQQEKPNVILIYADDMGKGMISAYGQQYLSTPNIDKLINNGVQFNNAYGCHFSAPARASLLTGYSDCTKGFWSNSKGGTMIAADTADIARIEAKLDKTAVRLPKDDEYLPEVFNKAGYVTGEIGKLEYAFASTRSQAASHGWDYYYGYLDHEACHGFFPPFLYENGKIVMIEGNTHTDCAKARSPYDDPKNVELRKNMEGKKQYSQHLFNEKIKDFIAENKKKPFFLYHPTQLPHGPVGVPYIHKDVEKMHNLTFVEKEYATMILLLDETVGMILDEVEKAGIADNTLIIFSVDNGHEIYCETRGRTRSRHDVRTGQLIDNCYLRFTSEVVGDYFNGNMGMTGKKRSNLDGGVVVPLTYYWPSKFTPRSTDELVANYDMIATLAELIGVDINEKKDAISYLPLLQSAQNKLPADRFVLVDSYEGPSIMSNDGWKLRYCNVSGEFELYHIKFFSSL